MDHIDLKESGPEFDLESGEVTSEDDQIKELRCHGRHKSVDGLSSSKSVYSGEGVEILAGEAVQEKMGIVKKKKVKGECKKSSSKKPPKPPRPPGFRSFDEADLKLVRELAEIARLKNARVERNKALKKKRADKASSPLYTIFALVITFLFCSVIIFQGILGYHI